MTVGPISFEVMEGEFFSLLGPSGCGKTTTLRCIAGFETLSDGSIAAGRRSGSTTGPPHRRDVGLVFQNYALFPAPDRVRQHRVRPAAAQGRQEARSSDGSATMLELVDLPDIAAPLPGPALGRPAAARRDRPLAGARAAPAPVRRAAVQPRLQAAHPDALRAARSAARLGKTAVYVTHDQTEALALSDRIAVLSQGRIEQVGTPSEIYERPATAFVADFIGSSNLLRRAGRAARSGANAAVETEHGLTLSIPRSGRRHGSDGDAAAVARSASRWRADVTTGSAIANRFTARVRDVTYLGEDLHLRVLALETQPLLVSIKNSKATRAPSPRAPRSIWRSTPRTSTCCGGRRAPDGTTPIARRTGRCSSARTGSISSVFLVLPFANVALLSVYLHSPTKIAVAEFTSANYAKLFELYYANLFLRTLRLSRRRHGSCARCSATPWPTFSPGRRRGS